MNGGLPFGSCLPGMDPVERKAQLRVLAAPAAVFRGWRNPLKALREGEHIAAAGARALKLLDRLPALTRRRVPTVYGEVDLTGRERL